MALAPGTRVGAYQILALIGAGGMGEVYRARDEKLGREVAVKVLPDAFSKNPERLARFEREAKALAALSHPNIVAIHDFATDGGRVYAVMELLDGESLAERLRSGALPPRKAIEIASQVARGLAAAHDKHTIHRDLKPANVFVTRDGRVKILDFGLASLRQDVGGTGPEGAAVQGESAIGATFTAQTQPGVMIGTAGYMSPEQVRGEPVDHRSDVFSFGAMLYEMISGRRAFRRGTSVETMTAVLKEDPPTRVDALSPALARIVDRCLEKKPDERFQSAHDLAFALDSLARASDPSVAADARTRRWMRAAGLAAALGACLALGYVLGNRADAGDGPQVSYQRLTFRRGTVPSGRFDPTGRGAYYAAAWDGGAVELFSTLPGSNESTALTIADADVLGVSARGELLVLRKGKRSIWELLRGVTGTLLRSSPGGTARPIADDVLEADWLPDGDSVAAARRVEGRWFVEWPLGTAVYDTPGNLDGFRVSPDGAWLAFGEKASGFGGHWSIVFVDRGGRHMRFDTGAGGERLDLAWSSDGREIWFNHVLGAGPEWKAMSTDGQMRVVLRPPMPLRLLDVSRDGRVLAARTAIRFGVMGRAPGEEREADHSWLDSTEVDGISGDGRTLLLTEFGEGVTADWAVFLRKSDRSPAVRLGAGQAFALSPDGTRALTMELGASPRLVILPTGIGERIELPRGNIVNFANGSWSPDGQHVVFAGAEKAAAMRYFRQDLTGGLPMPLTPEGQAGDGEPGARPVSPDGQVLALVDHTGQVVLRRIGGDAPPRTLASVNPGANIVRWSPDGRSLYVLAPSERSFAVHRIDASTGRVTLWKPLDAIDPVGLEAIYSFQIADDETSYYYTFKRVTSDLFLIEGLR